MNWTELALGFAGGAIEAVMIIICIRGIIVRKEATAERSRIISHAYAFINREREQSGRVSPTLIRFVRELESNDS